MIKDTTAKRWDGKENWEEASVLDELYDEAELVNGTEITVPWKLKGKSSTKNLLLLTLKHKPQEQISMSCLLRNFKICIAKECEPKSNNDGSN